eukprot:2846556-Pyramimonas_sp.AAC.1
MKLCFAPRPRGFKDVLQEGGAVAKLVGYKAAEVDPAESGWAAVSARMQAQQVDTVMFVHIGSMLFNPYEPTYQRMMPIPCPWVSMEASSLAIGRLWLKALQRCHTLSFQSPGSQ